MLANMAASADCREEVTRNGGTEVLLQFLDATHHAHAQQSGGGGGEGRQQDHPQNQNEEGERGGKFKRRPEDFAQMAATERVLQKSAIALSR